MAKICLFHLDRSLYLSRLNIYILSISCLSYLSSPTPWIVSPYNHTCNPALTWTEEAPHPALAPYHLLQASCGLSVRKCGSRACAVTSWTGGTSWTRSSCPCTWRPSCFWPGWPTGAAGMPRTGLPAATSPRLVSASQLSPESPSRLPSLVLGLSPPTPFHLHRAE